MSAIGRYPVAVPSVMISRHLAVTAGHRRCLGVGKVSSLKRPCAAHRLRSVARRHVAAVRMSDGSPKVPLQRTEPTDGPPRFSKCGHRSPDRKIV
jgi:hypothetical protein